MKHLGLSLGLSIAFLVQACGDDTDSPDTGGDVRLDISDDVTDAAVDAGMDADVSTDAPSDSGGDVADVSTDAPSDSGGDAADVSTDVPSDSGSDTGWNPGMPCSGACPRGQWCDTQSGQCEQMVVSNSFEQEERMDQLLTFQSILSFYAEKTQTPRVFADLPNPFETSDNSNCDIVLTREHFRDICVVHMSTFEVPASDTFTVRGEAVLMVLSEGDVQIDGHVSVTPYFQSSCYTNLDANGFPTSLDTGVPMFSREVVGSYGSGHAGSFGTIGGGPTPGPVLSPDYLLEPIIGGGCAAEGPFSRRTSPAGSIQISALGAIDVAGTIIAYGWGAAKRALGSGGGVLLEAAGPITFGTDGFVHAGGIGGEAYGVRLDWEDEYTGYYGRGGIRGNSPGGRVQPEYLMHHYPSAPLTLGQGGEGHSFHPTGMGGAVLDGDPGSADPTDPTAVPPGGPGGGAGIVVLRSPMLTQTFVDSCNYVAGTGWSCPFSSGVVRFSSDYRSNQNRLAAAPVGGTPASNCGECAPTEWCDSHTGTPVCRPNPIVANSGVYINTGNRSFADLVSGLTPLDPRDLPTSFYTGMERSPLTPNCSAVLGRSQRPDICLIYVESLRVPAGANLRFRGMLAPLIVSLGDVEIEGEVTFQNAYYSLHPAYFVTQAGNYCRVKAGNSHLTGGGGGGFGTPGGRGGRSLGEYQGSSGTPGYARPLDFLLEPLEGGGCGGSGVHAGGAVQITSLGSIRVNGVFDVNGDGGPGEEGGGALWGNGHGGGAGGAVLLEAANQIDISSSGFLYATGGGGGGSGCGDGVDGEDGERHRLTRDSAGARAQTMCGAGVRIGGDGQSFHPDGSRTNQDNLDGLDAQGVVPNGGGGAGAGIIVLRTPTTAEGTPFDARCTNVNDPDTSELIGQSCDFSTGVVRTGAMTFSSM